MRFLGGLTLLIAMSTISSTANAQWMYPGGYGGYGMSKWGADPGAGYMAGLGSFARGQGVYQLEKAKADAINADTMIKWNKALRARQRPSAKRSRRKRPGRRPGARPGARERADRRDDPQQRALSRSSTSTRPSARTGRSKTPLSSAAIREIPFEWDSEAITICLDQMTGQGFAPRRPDGAEVSPATAMPSTRPSSRRSSEDAKGERLAGDQQAHQRRRRAASGPSS